MNKLSTIIDEFNNNYDNKIQSKSIYNKETIEDNINVNKSNYDNIYDKKTNKKVDVKLFDYIFEKNLRDGKILNEQKLIDEYDNMLEEYKNDEIVENNEDDENFKNDVENVEYIENDEDDKVHDIYEIYNVNNKKYYIKKIIEMKGNKNVESKLDNEEIIDAQKLKDKIFKRIVKRHAPIKKHKEDNTEQFKSILNNKIKKLKGRLNNEDNNNLESKTKSSINAFVKSEEELETHKENTLIKILNCYKEVSYCLGKLTGNRKAIENILYFDILNWIKENSLKDSKSINNLTIDNIDKFIDNTNVELKKKISEKIESNLKDAQNITKDIISKMYDIISDNPTESNKEIKKEIHNYLEENPLSIFNSQDFFENHLKKIDIINNLSKEEKDELKGKYDICLDAYTRLDNKYYDKTNNYLPQFIDYFYQFSKKHSIDIFEKHFELTKQYFSFSKAERLYIGRNIYYSLFQSNKEPSIFYKSLIFREFAHLLNIKVNKKALDSKFLNIYIKRHLNLKSSLKKTLLKKFINSGYLARDHNKLFSNMAQLGKLYNKFKSEDNSTILQLDVRIKLQYIMKQRMNEYNRYVDIFLDAVKRCPEKLSEKQRYEIDKLNHLKFVSDFEVPKGDSIDSYSYDKPNHVKSRRYNNYSNKSYDPYTKKYFDNDSDLYNYKRRVIERNKHNNALNKNKHIIDDLLNNNNDIVNFASRPVYKPPQNSNKISPASYLQGEKEILREESQDYSTFIEDFPRNELATDLLHEEALREYNNNITETSGYEPPFDYKSFDKYYLNELEELYLADNFGTKEEEELLLGEYDNDDDDNNNNVENIEESNNKTNEKNSIDDFSHKDVKNLLDEEDKKKLTKLNDDEYIEVLDDNYLSIVKKNNNNIEKYNNSYEDDIEALIEEEKKLLDNKNLTEKERTKIQDDYTLKINNLIDLENNEDIDNNYSLDLKNNINFDVIDKKNEYLILKNSLKNYYTEEMDNFVSNRYFSDDKKLELFDEIDLQYLKKLRKNKDFNIDNYNYYNNEYYDDTCIYDNDAYCADAIDELIIIQNKVRKKIKELDINNNKNSDEEVQVDTLENLDSDDIAYDLDCIFEDMLLNNKSEKNIENKNELISEEKADDELEDNDMFLNNIVDMHYKTDIENNQQYDYNTEKLEESNLADQINNNESTIKKRKNRESMANNHFFKYLIDKNIHENEKEDNQDFDNEKNDMLTRKELDEEFINIKHCLDKNYSPSITIEEIEETIKHFKKVRHKLAITTLNMNYQKGLRNILVDYNENKLKDKMLRNILVFYKGDNKNLISKLKEFREFNNKSKYFNPVLSKESYVSFTDAAINLINREIEYSSMAKKFNEFLNNIDYELNFNFNRSYNNNITSPKDDYNFKNNNETNNGFINNEYKENTYLIDQDMSKEVKREDDESKYKTRINKSNIIQAFSIFTAFKDVNKYYNSESYYKKKTNRNRYISQRNSKFLEKLSINNKESPAIRYMKLVKDAYDKDKYFLEDLNKLIESNKSNAIDDSKDINKTDSKINNLIDNLINCNSIYKDESLKNYLESYHNLVNFDINDFKLNNVFLSELENINNNIDLEIKMSQNINNNNNILSKVIQEIDNNPNYKHNKGYAFVTFSNSLDAKKFYLRSKISIEDITDLNGIKVQPQLLNNSPAEFEIDNCIKNLKKEEKLIVKKQILKEAENNLSNFYNESIKKKDDLTNSYINKILNNAGIDINKLYNIDRNNDNNNLNKVDCNINDLKSLSYIKFFENMKSKENILDDTDINEINRIKKGNDHQLNLNIKDILSKEIVDSVENIKSKYNNKSSNDINKLYNSSYDLSHLLTKSNIAEISEDKYNLTNNCNFTNDKKGRNNEFTVSQMIDSINNNYYIQPNVDTNKKSEKSTFYTNKFSQLSSKFPKEKYLSKEIRKLEEDNNLINKDFVNYLKHSNVSRSNPTTDIVEHLSPLDARGKFIAQERIKTMNTDLNNQYFRAYKLLLEDVDSDQHNNKVFSFDNKILENIDKIDKDYSLYKYKHLINEEDFFTNRFNKIRSSEADNMNIRSSKQSENINQKNSFENLNNLNRLKNLKESDLFNLNKSYDEIQALKYKLFKKEKPVLALPINKDAYFEDEGDDLKIDEIDKSSEAYGMLKSDFEDVQAVRIENFVKKQGINLEDLYKLDIYKENNAKTFNDSNEFEYHNTSNAMTSIEDLNADPYDYDLFVQNINSPRYRISVYSNNSIKNKQNFDKRINNKNDNTDYNNSNIDSANKDNTQVDLSIDNAIFNKNKNLAECEDSINIKQKFNNDILSKKDRIIQIIRDKEETKLEERKKKYINFIENNFKEEIDIMPSFAKWFENEKKQTGRLLFNTYYEKKNNQNYDNYMKDKSSVFYKNDYSNIFFNENTQEDNSLNLKIKLNYLNKLNLEKENFDADEFKRMFIDDEQKELKALNKWLTQYDKDLIANCEKKLSNGELEFTSNLNNSNVFNYRHNSENFDEILKLRNLSGKISKNDLLNNKWKNAILNNLKDNNKALTIDVDNILLNSYLEYYIEIEDLPKHITQFSNSNSNNLKINIKSVDKKNGRVLVSREYVKNYKYDFYKILSYYCQKTNISNNYIKSLILNIDFKEINNINNSFIDNNINSIKVDKFDLYNKSNNFSNLINYIINLNSEDDIRKLLNLNNDNINTILENVLNSVDIYLKKYNIISSNKSNSLKYIEIINKFNGMNTLSFVEYLNSLIKIKNLFKSDVSSSSDTLSYNNDDLKEFIINNNNIQLDIEQILMLIKIIQNNNIDKINKLISAFNSSIQNANKNITNQKYSDIINLKKNKTKIIYFMFIKDIVDNSSLNNLEKSIFYLTFNIVPDDLDKTSNIKNNNKNLYLQEYNSLYVIWESYKKSILNSNNNTLNKSKFNLFSNLFCNNTDLDKDNIKNSIITKMTLLSNAYKIDNIENKTDLNTAYKDIDNEIDEFNFKIQEFLDELNNLRKCL